MSFWEGKKVLVTGGAGFIGSFTVERLLRGGAEVRVADNLENGRLENLRSCKEAIAFMEGDLRDRKVCMEACRGMEIVLNLAAKVGGIDFNKKHPGTMFTSNALIDTNMLEAARLCGVERYLCVSSACIYPRHSRYPTPEEDGFKDVPEPTNIGYGWAKRMAEVQAQCYAEEYGMEIAIARPYNTYGPRDHFDGDKAHVIPALIRRVLSGEDPLIVWGSGEQSRSFVYVEDIVEGMLLLTEKYPKADPVNLGSDEEIKIKDLARLIVDLSGRTCEIRFDKTKPDGHPRRNSDNTKAKEKIGFEAKVPLKEGLKKTIDWYRHEG